MDATLETVLRKGNYVNNTQNLKNDSGLILVFIKVFTLIFATEAFLKLIALSPKKFFCNTWNCFDFIIVFCSILEIFLEGIRGFSIFRSFRLVSFIIPIILFLWNFINWLATSF